MPEKPSTTRVISAATLLVIALLSGCQTTTDWLKGRRTASPDDPIILGAPEADAYLSELFELASGDPATQAEIFADAESAATLTPDTSTRLRYALVLATPGHSESNGTQAQSLLRELLAQQELMTNAEISLATIFLRDVEARIVLDAEARRLRAESNRASATEAAAINQRLARIEAENRQLRESLAAAEAKLEAITTIERSIREQSGNDDPQ